jgi:hypothetical protein
MYLKQMELNAPSTKRYGNNLKRCNAKNTTWAARDASRGSRDWLEIQDRQMV